MLLLRHASTMYGPDERRWEHVPSTPQDTHVLLGKMVRRGELRPLRKLHGLYEVTVPYVREGQIEEDEVLMEAHPYAAIAYLSALVFHGLTDEVPKVLFAVVPADGKGAQLPLGTIGNDWSDLKLVSGRTPEKILGTFMHWKRLSPERFFGVAEYRPRGYPVRVSTPERTLLDGLLQPDLCGGFENALRAWVIAQDTLHMDRLVDCVQQFNIGVLRQRVGFILEQLRRTNATVEGWAAHANRGGSSKLLGSAPYASTYSERWNLSINAPITVLQAYLA
jgi:predicted transcriptional regulator of viral defense system